MLTWLESNDNEDDVSFFHKRKEGAAKIASQSKEKGGASILTYWHFAAKSRPYSEVVKAIEEGKNEKWFRDKVNMHLRTIHAGMKQREFQQAMGALEVWGEALAKLFL